MGCVFKGSIIRSHPFLEYAQATGIAPRPNVEARLAHRRSVSDTRLVIEDHHAERARDLPGRIGRFAGRRRRRQHASTDPPIDRLAGLVFGNEVLVAIVFHQPHDAIECEIPEKAFPIISSACRAKYIA
jgi:hypothetical protein